MSTANGLAKQWRQCFFSTLERHPSASLLKQAASDSDLTAWTRELTTVTADTCDAVGWQAAAKGHKLHRLPQAGHEYLSLDVTAFETNGLMWPFPVAVMELENVQDASRVAYSLWKVLCVRCPLRVVYCYRQKHSEARDLVEELRHQVIAPLPVPERLALGGETMITVGVQGKTGIFPHGFFKSWLLDLGTGQFSPMAGG